jgi:AcrR family transcriptional regulator
MYYFTSKEHILLETLAWSEHEETRRRRAVLPEIAGPWRQLERFTDLYLPSGPADPAWILWTEAWARAPHDAEMSGFLDELMHPWYDDLAEIVHRGVQEGTFGLQVRTGDFTIGFCALLDGLAMIHLHPKPYLPRERLIELAMATARAQLTPAAPGDAGVNPVPIQD